MKSLPLRHKQERESRRNVNSSFLQIMYSQFTHHNYNAYVYIGLQSIIYINS